MKVPDRINLGNLPTPIFDFNRINPNQKFSNLYIKRDDFTGIEMSGNKVRKLEYALKEALDLNADVFITCGGVQSNHARATASAAAMLGKQSHLVLRGEEELEGNLLLDKLLGAKISYINDSDYSDITNILENIKKEYEKEGKTAYILPTGASNGIGLFGYYNAFYEILEWEKENNIVFDTICVAEGSCGTYGGLYLGNEISNSKKNIIGFNISDINMNSKDIIIDIINEAINISGYEKEVNFDNIKIIYDYAGEGYGITNKEVVEFIKDTSKKTGTIFDPVYTGKALYGLTKEIEKENPLFKGNVLFIHTGGLFGLFPKKDLFI